MSNIVKISFWVVAASNGVASVWMRIEKWFFMDGSSDIQIWRHEISASIYFIIFMVAVIIINTYKDDSSE